MLIYILIFFFIFLIGWQIYLVMFYINLVEGLVNETEKRSKKEYKTYN